MGDKLSRGQSGRSRSRSVEDFHKFRQYKRKRSLSQSSMSGSKSGSKSPVSRANLSRSLGLDLDARESNLLSLEPELSKTAGPGSKNVHGDVTISVARRFTLLPL